MSAAHDLTVQWDDAVDYEETARLANEAFPAGGFTARQMQWLYERCFGHGAIVVSLRDAGRKVGQFVILRQTLNVCGERERAAQLVDLFVLNAYRSRAALAKLYDEVAKQCERNGIRFAIGMPNTKAISANEFFFGLKPHLWLDIRAGLAIPGLLSPALLINAPFDPSQVRHYTHWFEAFEPAVEDNGIAWRAAEICERLTAPDFRYGLHMVENLLLISSPRIRRGIPYVLHCGFFMRRGRDVTRRDFRAVTRSAARLWDCPLFVYPGVFRALRGLPGWRLPRWLRPSTMLVQMRDFEPQKPTLQWDRYQPIDFDFA